VHHDVQKCGDDFFLTPEDWQLEKEAAKKNKMLVTHTAGCETGPSYACPNGHWICACSWILVPSPSRILVVYLLFSLRSARKVIIIFRQNNALCILVSNPAPIAANTLYSNKSSLLSCFPSIVKYVQRLHPEYVISLLLPPFLYPYCSLLDQIRQSPHIDQCPAK
jgi:hypothetical protein